MRKHQKPVCDIQSIHIHSRLHITVFWRYSFGRIWSVKLRIRIRPSRRPALTDTGDHVAVDAPDAKECIRLYERVCSMVA